MEDTTSVGIKPFDSNEQKMVQLLISLRDKHGSSNPTWARKKHDPTFWDQDLDELRKAEAADLITHPEPYRCNARPEPDPDTLEYSYTPKAEELASRMLKSRTIERETSREIINEVFQEPVIPREPNGRRSRDLFSNASLEDQILWVKGRLCDVTNPILTDAQRQAARLNLGHCLEKDREHKLPPDLRLEAERVASEPLPEIKRSRKREHNINLQS